MPLEKMQPPFNSFDHQTHSDSSTSTLPQPVFRPKMLQNSVPMQPPMGIMNPQIPFPWNNSNMPPTPLTTQTNFMNASNPFLFAQNNNLCLPQLNHMFPVHAAFGYMPQNVPQGQVFGPNFSNLPQQMHQNIQLQTLNQLLSMQMTNPSTFGNPQFGLVNQKQQNFVQPIKDAPGNSCMPLKSCSSEPQQGQNLQPSAFMRSQNKFVQNGQDSILNSKWKNVPGKNPRKLSQGFHKPHFHQMNNAKRNFGFHNDRKAKGRGNGRAMKFGQANHMNQPQEKKRKSLALTYTEQEIKHWCEQRRRNYPTKANINKKLTKKLSNSDVIDKDVKMRREQLKYILAKQAELGVEVAEIPLHYLSDSEKQVHQSVENARPLHKRGRFQNKHDKRRRCNRKDHFAAKRQRLAEKDSSNTLSFNRRKPTLLQKLLSADIKREKIRLLQAFRFIKLNSFFKDWPEKSSKFPLVMVEEDGVAGKVVEEKSLFSHNEVSEGRSSRMVEQFDNDNDDNNNNIERKSHNFQDFEVEDDDDNEDDNGNVEQINSFEVGGKGDIGSRSEEEEGEIID